MDQVDVTNGAHILYYYTNHDAYIKNATSFLINGLIQDEHVVFIDSEPNYMEVIHSLTGRVGRDVLERIHYVNHVDFYYEHGMMLVSEVMNNFAKLFAPLQQDLRAIRSWGQVPWDENGNNAEQLLIYEHRCDSSILNAQMLGVCAYDAKRIPAYVQNEMMRSHEYFMTDDSLAPSMFYRDTSRSVIIPSPAVHMEMQSEMDLYKQKLDFAHAVSHEVRNPLTVIRAYAMLMLNPRAEMGEDHIRKLQAIVDYVDVIDHEIAHIINTEQLLSTDTLWQKEAVSVKPLLDEVLHMMTTKARTQGVECHSLMNVQEAQIYGSSIGFKLIVSNLISNAIKYSHEGSSISVHANVRDGKLQLEVRDKGVGMSKEQLEKLFRKYEKMNTDKSGQGIGLFMVKKLTDHFEGSIDVKSELCAGTEVQVELPLLTESSIFVNGKMDG
ncbi:GHKL domain-containing protein [Paenibacillus sp. 1011MAR3C5]|uniref:ATP-binding protein n=1 Tax=Paenibacillus sp. 1011MAR3C5 TaxID=1675787 RepID=UPI000E6C9BFC|nr:ATP-binding protein [Paenibacillus sp. 1011MAR3C5]RJE91335.1 GHKL domain-containing protein [Paenibacillus sp. 1011MAR3C5]